MKCGLCGEIAKKLCLDCNNYFCESCFKFIHEKKNNVGHKNEEIDLFIPFEARCSIHPDIPMNYFVLLKKNYAAHFANF